MLTCLMQVLVAQGVDIRSTINSGCEIYTIGNYTLVSVIGQPLVGMNQVGPSVLVNGAFKDSDGSTEQTVVESLHELESVFPNPADDRLTITYFLNGDSKVRFQLIGMDGKVVRDIPADQQPAGSHQFEMDVSSVQSGVYQLVFFANGLPKTKRIVVQ